MKFTNRVAVTGMHPKCVHSLFFCVQFQFARYEGMWVCLSLSAEKVCDS